MERDFEEKAEELKERDIYEEVSFEGRREEEERIPLRPGAVRGGETRRVRELENVFRDIESQALQLRGALIHVRQATEGFASEVGRVFGALQVFRRDLEEEAGRFVRTLNYLSQGVDRIADTITLQYRALKRLSEESIGAGKLFRKMYGEGIEDFQRLSGEARRVQSEIERIRRRVEVRREREGGREVRREAGEREVFLGKKEMEEVRGDVREIGEVVEWLGSEFRNFVKRVFRGRWWLGIPPFAGELRRGFLGRGYWRREAESFVGEVFGELGRIQTAMLFGPLAPFVERFFADIRGRFEEWRRERRLRREQRRFGVSEEVFAGFPIVEEGVGAGSVYARRRFRVGEDVYARAGFVQEKFGTESDLMRKAIHTDIESVQEEFSAGSNLVKEAVHAGARFVQEGIDAGVKSVGMAIRAGVESIREGFGMVSNFMKEAVHAGVEFMQEKADASDVHAIESLRAGAGRVQEKVGVGAGFLQGSLVLKEGEIVQERGAEIYAEKLFIRTGGIGELGRGLRDLFGGIFLGRGMGRVGRILQVVFRRLVPLALFAGAGYEVYRGMKGGDVVGGVVRGGGLVGGGLLGGAIAGPVGAIIGAFLGDLLADAVYKGMKKLVKDSEWVRSLRESFTSAIGWFGSILSTFVGLVKKGIETVGKGVGEVKKGVRGVVEKSVKAIGEQAAEVGRKVTELGGRTIDALRWMGEQLGIVARIAEAGTSDMVKASQVVSKTVGDIGGMSLGMYQFTRDAVQKFLKEYGYEEEFAGVRFGTVEFERKWKEVAQRYGEEFARAQHEFAVRRYLLPGLRVAERFGIDARRSRALQEMVFARVVQHGVRGWERVLENVFGKMSREVVQAMSPEEVVDSVYQHLIENVERYWRRSSERVRRGVRERLIREREVLMEMGRAERRIVEGELLGARVAEMQEVRRGLERGRVVDAGFMQEQEARRKRIVEVEVEREETLFRRIGEEMKGVLGKVGEVVGKMSAQRPVMLSGGEAFARVSLTVEDMAVLLLQMGLV